MLNLFELSQNYAKLVNNTKIGAQYVKSMHFTPRISMKLFNDNISKQNFIDKASTYLKINEEEKNILQVQLKLMMMN